MVINILLLLLSIVILCVAFSAKAKMDLSGADKFVGKDYTKNSSYTSDNKWSLPYEKGKRTWYYLWLYKPDYVERFWYSSTALVFLTDYWHKQQFIFLNLCFVGNVLLYLSIDKLLICNSSIKLLICLILIRLIYLIGFNLSYRNGNK